MEFSHASILLKECVEGLSIKPNGVYVDGTAGGAGHSSKIAEKLDKGLLIALDQDEDAIKVCNERLSLYKDNVKVVKANFADLRDVLQSLSIEKIDGFLADLGVSSYQLDNGVRGFSYSVDAPLDMRMDKGNSLSAWEVVNNWSFEEIRRILWEFGEEKFSSKIASKIVSERVKAPINTTFELADIIKSAMPGFAKREKQHPAKRSFQAIRIAVNDELGALQRLLFEIIDLVKSDGRIAIITFHSLEDRAVKVAFNELAKGCICPKGFPICVCNNKPKVEVITRKPIIPDEEELERNPRARSAKLRIARVL
jgi:16S rRNA (cytosine1402-N4)-methyltransferase